MGGISNPKEETAPKKAVNKKPVGGIKVMIDPTKLKPKVGITVKSIKKQSMDSNDDDDILGANKKQNKDITNTKSSLHFDDDELFGSNTKAKQKKVKKAAMLWDNDSDSDDSPLNTSKKVTKAKDTTTVKQAKDTNELNNDFADNPMDKPKPKKKGFFDDDDFLTSVKPTKKKKKFIFDSGLLFIVTYIYTYISYVY